MLSVIGNFLHFGQTLGTSFGRHQTNGASYGGYVRITFACEPAEHRGEFHSKFSQLVQCLVGILFCPVRPFRSVQLNVSHPNFPSDRQGQSQARVSAGKDANLPFFQSCSPILNCLTIPERTSRPTKLPTVSEKITAAKRTENRKAVVPDCLAPQFSPMGQSDQQKRNTVEKPPLYSRRRIQTRSSRHLVPSDGLLGLGTVRCHVAVKIEPFGFKLEVTGLALFRFSNRQRRTEGNDRIT